LVEFENSVKLNYNEKNSGTDKNMVGFAGWA
jgi:hypothetical protein